MPVWFIQKKGNFNKEVIEPGARRLGFQPQFADSRGQSRKVASFSFQPLLSAGMRPVVPLSEGDGDTKVK